MFKKFYLENIVCYSDRNVLIGKESIPVDYGSLPPRSQRQRGKKANRKNRRRIEIREDSIQRSRRSRQKEQGNDWKDWLLAIGVALVLAVIIRTLIAEPTAVSGKSMSQTLQAGDKVMVNKFVYLISEPKRGDVVIFQTEEGHDLIKRVVGLPGDQIEAKEGKVFVNGKELSEPYLDNHIKTSDFDLTKVPEGQYFVLGDNRSESADSRLLGTIPKSDMIGRASWIYWPLSRFGSVNK